jgi:glycine cleavage system H lipoate-binding protein
LLAQSAVVDSAAAAQLSRAPEQGVVAASQVHASQSDKFASTTAPAVHLDASNISRTNSGPEANMDDPDAYFDQVDRMEGRTAPSPAVRFVHIHGGYVEAAVPAPVLGELADQNADVRDVAKNYRDPAGAIQQDKFADKVKSGPSLGSSDLGDSIKSGLKDAQKKATKAVSALPTPAVGDLADLNADVRNDATDYRDPAIAVPQDKVSGAVSGSSSGISTPDLSGAADAAKSKLDKAAKAVSALPTPAVGDLADLNADVRGVSKNYRDPAGAVQQDKFADKVKSGPSLGSSDLGDSIKSGLKDAQKKATKAVSALPTPAVGDLADLNADVRGDAADYRDPAGAIQQDTAAGAVKSQLPDLSAQKATTPSAKKLGKKVVSTVTQTKRDIGVKAGYGASGSRVRDSTGKLITADDVRGTNPAIGNARLSQPLVRDSLGVKRAGSQNQTGAAGGADRKGVIEPLKEVVDRVAN